MNTSPIRMYTSIRTGAHLFLLTTVFTAPGIMPGTYYMPSKFLTNEYTHEWGQLQLPSPPVCHIKNYTAFQKHFKMLNYRLLWKLWPINMLFYLIIISAKRSAHEIHIHTNISVLQKKTSAFTLRSCLFQAMEHKVSESPKRNKSKLKNK